MGKRGSSQIDWIISLSLFLIYITWFFIFIQPSINLGSNKDTLISILKENFEEDSAWSLKKYPVFVESNFSGGRKTIMLDYNSNITDIFILDNVPFALWKDKLFLLANVSEGMNVFWIVEGTNQSDDSYFEGLNAERDRASTENLTVYFEESMPQRIFYREDEFLEDLSYEINGIEFSIRNSTYDNRGFVSFYTATNGNINHTSIISAYSPEIENFISLEQEGSYVVTIYSELNHFDSYYSDNNNFGDFLYSNESQNINYSFDYLTLTKGRESLSVFFSSDVDFNFTYFNTTLLLDMTLPLDKEFYYRLQFHDGNYTSSKLKHYSSEFGTIEYLEGINLNNISSNYSYLKSKWGFPEERDFKIFIYENSTAFLHLEPDAVYETSNPIGTGKNIYSEAQNINSLESDGNLKKMSIVYRIW